MSVLGINLSNDAWMVVGFLLYVAFISFVSYLIDRPGYCKVHKKRKVFYTHKGDKTRCPDYLKNECK